MKLHKTRDIIEKQHQTKKEKKESRRGRGQEKGVNRVNKEVKKKRYKERCNLTRGKGSGNQSCKNNTTNILI